MAERLPAPDLLAKNYILNYENISDYVSPENYSSQISWALDKTQSTRGPSAFNSSLSSVPWYASFHLTLTPI